MFRGIFTVNLDAKGRMAIPVRYRQRLLDEAQKRLVVTIDTEENCLLLYPQQVWEGIEQKISHLPSFNPAARRIQRLFIGHANEIEMDRSGRILLPPLLRDYADLSKHVVLIGQGNKFELWDEKNWNTRRENWLSEKNIDSNALPEGLSDLTL